jgi:hypothetical protein
MSAGTMEKIVNDEEKVDRRGFGRQERFKVLRLKFHAESG